MAKIKFTICFLCLAAIGWSGMSHRDMLTRSAMFDAADSSTASEGSAHAVYEYPETRQMNRMLMGEHIYAKSQEFNRMVFYKKLIPIAEAELWVREATGRNDGPRVEAYLASVGLKKGQPYCAAFVSWVFKQAGYSAPRTGWSPSLFPTSRLVKAAAPGNVFGIYFPALKRIAHCGLVTGTQGDWVKTIEGNTDASAGREGDGVYRRLRPKKSIKAYADWTQTSNNQVAGRIRKGGKL